MSGHQGNVTELTKVCGKCGAPKPLIDFQVRNKSTGSRSAWCRACHTKNTREKREARIVAGVRTPEQKVCRTCLQVKPASEFHKSRGTFDGLQTYCSDCQGAKQKASYKANRKRAIARSVRSSRKSRYGITQETYDALKYAQGNKCAICRTPFDELTRSPSVDHCHVSKKIRGLLCSPCNTGIGLLRESEQIFLQALQYLREHREAE